MSHVCTVKELINGVISTPTQSLTPQLTDPDTGEVLHSQLATSLDQVETAIAVAYRVHESGAWTSLPQADRAAALRRLQAELTARIAEIGIGDSLDNGVPQMWTMAINGARAGFIETYAAQIEKGFELTETETSIGTVAQWRLPWGPAAIFLPWNAAGGTAVLKVAEALTAGCPVIIKTSEWAPHFTGPFAEAVLAAGLPDGLVQIVHGDKPVGETIVNDPRIAAVSYTGGVPGGTAVAEACARQLKPVDLELSGNNPVVVLPGVDPAEVIGGVLMGMTFLNGQACIGPRRLIVPEDQLDVYAAGVGAALDSITIGPSTDPTTVLGPIAHVAHRDHLERQIAEFAELGCEVTRHGVVPEQGHYLQPAVIKADKGAELRTEIFGPVLQIRTYTDVDDAIRIANDHAYGLSAYIFGPDRDAARALGVKLRAAFVTVNNVLGGQTEVPMVGSPWGVSGLGVLGVGQGSALFSGYRFVG